MMKVLKTHSVRMAAGLLALMGLLVFGCKQDAGTETIVVAYTPLRSIEVTTPPAKVVYDIAEEPDFTGLRVTATYSDKSTKVIDNKDLMFSDFDTTTSGSKIVEIYYEEEDGRSAYAYFTILVNPYGKTLDRLEITADPDKTVYEVGDEDWDVSGMEVSAIWNDESSDIIDLWEAVISIDTSAPGEGSITVEWGTKKVSFTITTEAGVDELVFNTSNLFFLLTDSTLSNGGILDPALFDGLVITGISQKLVDEDPNDKTDPELVEVFRRILDNADCTFETIDDMGIPGRKVITVTYKNSITSNTTTGEITVKVLSQAMYQLAVYVKNAPASPVAVKVPAEVTRDDVMFDYGDDYGIDNLGGLYEALGNTKNINLDLSAVTWTVADADDNQVKGIPGAPIVDIVLQRPTSGVNKLSSLVLPNDIVQIGNLAFFNYGGQDLSFKDFNQLKQIGDNAFGNAVYLRTLDFTGCTALEIIGASAFVQAGSSAGTNGVQMLDLADCVSLKRWGDNAFHKIANLKYVELPPASFNTGDYSMNHAYNLEYIRFRTTAPRVGIGWSTWLYTQNLNPASMFRTRHRKPAETDGSNGDATMQTYIMYHPNTVAWVSQVGEYWSNEYSNDHHMGHSVPLPLNSAWNQEGDAVYEAALDQLRGAELIGTFYPANSMADIMNSKLGTYDNTYNDGIRGQSTVEISASNLPASLNGKTVTVKLNGKDTGNTAVINGGNFTLSVGTPQSGELMQMNTTNLQAITGYYNYSDASKNNNPAAPGQDNPYSYIRHQGATNWTANRFSGSWGEPVYNYGLTSPGSTNRVDFAVLELAVEGGGNLTRWAKGKYTRTWDSGAVNTMEEVRVLKYVYVSRDTPIFRIGRTRPATSDMSAGSLSSVYMSLKQGWNQIEAAETITNPDDSSSAFISNEVTGAGAKSGISIRVSGAVVVDNSGGTPELKGPVGEGLNINQTTINIPYKTIPWVYRAQDDWNAMVSPVEASKVGSPYRQPTPTP